MNAAFHKKTFLNRNSVWIVIALLAIAGYIQYYKSNLSHLGPGVLVKENPQFMPVNYASAWTSGEYTITPIASFNIRARVLRTRKYHWDRASDLSPIDVVFGWGDLSDKSVIDNLSFSQSQRTYSWKERGAVPVTEDYINSHLINLHLIPANNEIKNAIQQLHSNQIISMSGNIVNVTSKDGYTWENAENRSGANINEIFWVNSITILQQ